MPSILQGSVVTPLRCDFGSLIMTLTLTADSYGGIIVKISHHFAKL